MLTQLISKHRLRQAKNIATFLAAVDVKSTHKHRHVSEFNPAQGLGRWPFKEKLYNCCENDAMPLPERIRMVEAIENPSIERVFILKPVHRLQSTAN